MTGATDLNYDAWDEQFTALFDHALGNLPTEDAEISVTALEPRRTGDPKWHDLGSVPFTHDAAANAWAIIEPYARKGASCYFGVGIRKDGTGRQGGAKDILAHSALGVDLDVSDGNHKLNDGEEHDFIERVTPEVIADLKAANAKLPIPTAAEADSWTQDEVDLWLDAKGKLPLPTVDLAYEWVDGAPLTVTLVNETGGGLHAYWVFERPLDLMNDPVGRAARAGWIAYWTGIRRTSRRWVDDGPLKNLAGVLRISGTGHAKSDAIVTITDHNDGVTHSAADWLAAFPLSEDDTKRVESIDRGASTGLAFGIADPDSASPLSTRERPLDRFTDEMPLAAVSALVGVEWKGTVARVGWQDANGDYVFARGATNASAFMGEDEPLIKLYGESTLAEWQQALGSDKATFTAAEILVLALRRIGIDSESVWKVAATLAARYRLVEDDTASYPGLIEALVDAASPEDVQALLHARAPQPKAPATAPAVASDAPGADVAVVEDASTSTDYRAVSSARPFREALNNPQGEEYVIRARSSRDGENAVVARVSTDPEKHGLFARVAGTYEDKNGVPRVYAHYNRIADYLLYLDEINAFRASTGTDTHEVTGKDYARVTVALHDGRRYTTRPLPTDDSRSATKVVRELSTFVLLDEPFDAAETNAVAAMITGLGKLAVERNTVVNRIGWHLDEQGYLSYVTPNGALTLDDGKPAIRPNLIAAGSARGSKLRGTEWQQAIGFTHIARDIDLVTHMPKMIADLTACFPRNPAIAQALIASFFLSFLPGGNRSAIILVGVNSSMKSAVMRRLALLVADDANFRARRQPFSVNIDKDSEASARRATAFQGVAPNFAEDFLTSDNPRAAELERRVNILEELTTSSYSGAGAGRAEGTSDVAERVIVDSTPFITAEALDAGGSRIGRAITIPLAKGDVDASRLDEFTARWIATGKGRALMARWIAEALLEFNTTSEIADAVKDTRDATERSVGDGEQDNRISSNLTQVLAGTVFLRRFSLEANWDIDGARWVMEDADPSALIDFLSEDNRVRVVEANPAEKIVRSIVDGLATGTLYLENYAGGVPPIADRYGWREQERGGRVEWQHHGAKHIGRISADGSKVYLFAGGLKVAKEIAGVSGRTDAEIRSKLVPYLDSSYTPGGLVQSKNDMVDSTGSRYSQRCYVFPASVLNLPEITITEADTTLPTASAQESKRRGAARKADF